MALRVSSRLPPRRNASAANSRRPNVGHGGVRVQRWLHGGAPHIHVVVGRDNAAIATYGAANNNAMSEYGGQAFVGGAVAELFTENGARAAKGRGDAHGGLIRNMRAACVPRLHLESDNAVASGL